MVRVPGDGEHGLDEFGRSYDLAALGLASVRFIRVQGVNSPGNPEQSYGFDLDAIAAIHFIEGNRAADE